MQKSALNYQDAPWTFHLIGLNLAIYLLTTLDTANLALSLGILDVGAIINGQWWRILTATLLHANLMHLLFNCVGLLIFGSTLERIIGYRLYLLVYFGGGILANLLVVTIKYFMQAQYYAVGSSGAVIATIGSTAAIAWYMRRMQPSPAWDLLFQRMMLILGLQVMVDILIPTNSMLTHLAGFVSGLVIGGMLLYAMRSRNRL